MKSKILPFFCLASIMLVVSCQEDPEPSDPTSPPVPTADFEVKDLQVTLPEGSSFDFTGSEVFSFGESFPVSTDGKSKTVSSPGLVSIAYLFDEDENPILAGYVTDTVTSISPESTAIVLLSYAMGINLREEGFLELFLDQIGDLPEAVEFQEQFTELWKADPLILEKGSYTTQLREVMEKLVPEPEVIDIRAGAKVSDILVDDGDIRSGLNIFEDGLGQFSVNNIYRRRGHAYLYKMSYKDENGVNHEVLSGIESNTPSVLDFAIPPTAAATSFNGVLGAEIEGKSSEVGLVKIGPTKLDLEEIESEATYKLHVVGPGISHPQPVSTAEIAKLTRLEIETFALDFMFPLIMETFGNKDLLKKKGINIGEGPVEKFIAGTETFLKQTPDIYELVKNGDYLGAAKKSLELLITGGIDGNFEYFTLLAYDIFLDAVTVGGFNVPKSAAANAENVVGKTAKWLKIINTAMLGGDFIRIGMGILDSRQFEEWTIKARSTKVTLLPKEATVRSRGSKEITAEIKNLEEEEGDTHPFFVWKTSGEYGYIQDTQGNKGEAFESSDSKIMYYSNTSSADLPEENNFEYVYVEAFLGSQSIGKDTLKLNLKKSVYEIKPDGITLSGKEGNANSAKLHIERTDGSAPDFSDKKVVWTTPGQYGKVTRALDFSTSITTYGSNSIHYQCTDKDTEKASEKVFARIYAKSAVSEDYFLYEELEATININNEDNVIIKYVPISVISWGPTVSGIYTNCGSGTIFYIDPEPNAESYSATVIEFSPEVIPRVTGTSRSWSATAATNEDGKYEFAYILSGAGSSPTWIGPPDCGKFAASAGARKGMARVVIKLKND